MITDNTDERGSLGAAAPDGMPPRVPMAGLRARAALAARWVFASHAAEQGLDILRIVVLARLLVPRDFGVVGMAALMLSALESVSQPALDSVLVRERWSREDLDTAWTLGLARGLAIAALIWVLAPVVSAFFGVPLVVPLARVLSVSVVLRGAVNIGAQASFASTLRFSRLTAIDLVGIITGTIISIVMALIWPSVWALVLGTMTGDAARTAASFLMSAERPRLGFSARAARRLLGVGRWFAGTSALVYLATNLDDLLVGRLLGSAALGVYQVAYRVSNLPVTAISHVANRVAFPLYASLRAEPERLRAGYGQVLEAVAAVVVPATILLVLAGPAAAAVLLGARWAGAGLIIQLLAVFGLVRAMAGVFGALLQAVGSPHHVTQATAVQLLVMTPLLLWQVPQRGLPGAAIAVTAGSLVSWLVAGRYALRLLQWRGRDYLDAVWRPCLAGFFGFIAGAVAVTGLDGAHPLISLAAVTVIAGGTYALALAVLQGSGGTPDVRPGTMLRWQALRRVLRRHVRGMVVDVGGHDGWMLSQLGLRGVVLDADGVAVVRAVSAGQSAVVGWADRLPFRSQAVDTIVCLDTLEHVPDDDGLVRECARVLQPGGTLILTTPRSPMRIAPFVDMRRLERQWAHVRSGYTRAELDALCERHGLRVLDHGRYFNVISRWVYALLYLRGPATRLPAGLRLGLLTAVGFLEPVVRWGGAEHILVAERVR